MRLATSSASNKHQTKLPTWPARPVYRLCPRPAAGITGIPAPRSTARIEGPMAGAVIHANSQGHSGPDAVSAPSPNLSPAPPLAGGGGSTIRAARRRRARPFAARKRTRSPAGAGGRRSAAPAGGRERIDREAAEAELSAAGNRAGDLVGERKVAAALAERLLRSAGSGQQQRRI